MILTLNTAAPQAQASRVSLRGRLAAELIARQVAVEQAAKIETRFILRFFNDLMFQCSAEDTVCKKKSEFLTIKSILYGIVNHTLKIPTILSLASSG